MPHHVLVVHPGAQLYGSDRVVLETVIGLVSAGIAVTVALPDDGPLASALSDAGATVTIIPMLVLRKALLAPRAWPHTARLMVRAAAAAWRLLGEARWDAAYVSTITLPQWPLLARMRRVPVITHLHEAERSAPALLRLALAVPQLAANRIVANSAFSADVLSHSLPVLGKRTVIVYNPVPGPSHAGSPRAVPSPVRILFVGRLSPRKGPDLVVEAASSLKESGIPVHLDIVGDAFQGYEWFEAELRDLIESRGLVDDVRLHGFHPSIWPFLEEADLLVVPSRLDEPFGNTAVEGVLAMRPVVVSDTSGLREAGGGYETVAFFAPGDATDLAGSVRGILADWERIRVLVGDSAETARRRHSPESYHAAICAEIEHPRRLRSSAR